MVLTSLSVLSIRLSCGFRPKYCAAAFVAGRLWWSHWSVELGHAACIWGYLVQPLRGNLKLVYVGSQPMGMLLVVGYRGSCAPKADLSSLLGLGCNQGWTPPPLQRTLPPWNILAAHHAKKVKTAGQNKGHTLESIQFINGTMRTPKQWLWS